MDHETELRGRNEIRRKQITYSWNLYCRGLGGRGSVLELRKRQLG
jgi:hypothetical protein